MLAFVALFITAITSAYGSSTLLTASSNYSFDANSTGMCLANYTNTAGSAIVPFFNVTNYDKHYSAPPTTSSPPSSTSSTGGSSSSGSPPSSSPPSSSPPSSSPPSSSPPSSSPPSSSSSKSSSSSSNSPPSSGSHNHRKHFGLHNYAT